MDKVLVEVFLPAANTSFDVVIPLASSMRDVLMLVSSLLSELSNGDYLAGDNAVLCEAKSGNIYDINASVAELGIRNGSKLMLI